MLISLSVSNIALISRLDVSFSDGLHALTGETGAGKSILIDSISLLLGGKSSRELIRNGEKRAFVEGVFDLSDCPDAVAFLKSSDCEPEGNEITLSREITESGRSVCRVEGLTWQLNTYQQLTSLLMDLHGQHAQQSLMDEKKHLSFLDRFGGKQHAILLENTADAYRAWHTSDNELKKARRQALEKAERIEFLTYQKKELEAAHLTRGEEDELQKQRDMFRNADKIGSRLENAYEAVYGGAPSAVELVRNAARLLSEISGLDERFSALADRLEIAGYELEDIGLTLRDLYEEMPSDPRLLDQVEERLDTIRRLSRKYGATTDDMLNKLEEIRDALRSFTDLDGRIIDLETAEKKARAAYDTASARLTDARQKLARQFEKAVEGHLSDLSMSGTTFRVSFTPCPACETGSETACFLIAPNRGEALQSLAKTASGGELSRLMLAIKSVENETAGIPSMIFDEIDTGISGRTAQKVSEKMAALARTRQVLCVTHLQQIASAAKHHYLVEKSYDGERTVTAISELDRTGRVSEIARMLGGDPSSAQTHADQMLKEYGF